MKKTLYALTAGVMLSMGMTAYADSGVVVAPVDQSYQVPFVGDTSDGYSMSQVLYTASEMSAAAGNKDSYQLQALTYTVYSDITSLQGKVTVYLTAVDGSMTQFTTDAIPQSEWTKVYEGSVNASSFSDGKLTLQLDTPFAMEDGKGLVVTLLYEKVASQYCWFYIGNESSYSGTIRTLKNESYSPDNLEPRVGGAWTWYPTAVPALSITYAQGEVSDAFKVNVELEGPAETNVGKQTEFKVRLANNGTETLSDYTVTLVDQNNNELTSVAGTPVGVGQTDVMTVKYEFTEAAPYSIIAQVTKGNYLPANSAPASVMVYPYVPANLANVVLPKGAPYSVGYYNYFLNRDFTYSASQSIFPASYFSEFVGDLDIYSLAMTVTDEDYRFPVEMKIYLGQIDEPKDFDEDSSFVPEDAFTLVYDGTFEPPVKTDDNPTAKVPFYLNAPYTLEKGKSLVMNVLTRVPEGGDGWRINMLVVDTDKAYMRGGMCNYTDGSHSWMTLYANNSNAAWASKKYLPQVDFGYTVAQAPAKVDLAISKGSDWPEEGEAGKVVRFPVTITNQGTVDVQSFKIELLDYSSGDLDNPEVIYTEDVDDLITPGASSNIRIRYTFDKGGYYFIGARVVAEGDVDVDNDYIEPDVFEVPLPAIDLMVTGFSGLDEVTAGVENEYEVTVQNGGSERLSGNFTVEIIDADDNVISTAEASLSLPPNGITYFAVPVTFKTAGFYEVRARVNVEGDADTSSNVSEPLEVVVYPNALNNDLEVVSISGNAQAKTTIEEEYEVAVNNAGMEPASGFTIQIVNSGDNTLLASETINMRLAAQQMGYYAIPVTFETAGTYNIVARVIYADDEDESNNESQPLTVEVGKYNNGIASIAAEIEAGNVYNMQGFRISNVENLPAGIYIVNGKKIVIK